LSTIAEAKREKDSDRTMKQQDENKHLRIKRRKLIKKGIYLNA